MHGRPKQDSYGGLLSLFERGDQQTGYHKLHLTVPACRGRADEERYSRLALRPLLLLLQLAGGILLLVFGELGVGLIRIHVDGDVVAELYA